MTISGLLKKIVCTTAILGTLLGAPKKAEAESYAYLGGGIYSDMFSLASMKTVPEYIRELPAYSYGEGSSALIEDSGLNSLLLGLGIEGKVGIGIKQDNIDFRIGPKITMRGIWNFSPMVKKDSAFYRINGKITADEPKGIIFGASARLAYFFPGTNQISSIEDGEKIASLQYGIPCTTCQKGGGGPPLGHNWYIEYALDFLNLPLFLENGWDFQTSNKIYKKYDMPIDVINHAIRIGYETVYKGVAMGLFAGITFPQIIKKAPLADEVGFNFSPGFCIGMDMELSSREN